MLGTIPGEPRSARWNMAAARWCGDDPAPVTMDSAGRLARDPE